MQEPENVEVYGDRSDLLFSSAVYNIMLAISDAMNSISQYSFVFLTSLTEMVPVLVC
jgi:hypothetical protein